MTDKTDPVLSQIAADIKPEELEKTHRANKRVDAAYGAQGTGLILPVEIKVPDSDELY